MRAARAAALVLALAVLAGCGRDDTAIRNGGRVSGDTLTVYTLLPLHGPRAAVARQLVLGAKLALAQAQGHVGKLTVNYVSLDEPGRAGRLAANVQLAVRDTGLIAVIGDLDAQTARTTVPLLNATGILHVSPGVTDPAFAAPGHWRPSGKRTFSPLLPGPAAEAAALAGAARGRVAVEAESGDETAQALADAVRARTGRTVDTGRADTVVYVGSDPDSALGVLEGIARERPRARILAPQALWLTDLPGRLRGAARRRTRFATSVGAASDPRFARAYRAAYGLAPDGPWAQVGWDGMRRVLAAIARAGARANSRQAVIDAYFAADPAAAAARRPFRLARPDDPASAATG